MKVIEKTALGIAIALILICLASIAVLLFTDFGTDFLKSSGELSAAGRELIALDVVFPFTPPEGAGIPKERLEPFFTVSCRTKASAERVQKSIEETGQVRVAGEPVFGGEQAKLLTAYMKDLKAALLEAKMGPEEFDWIHQRLRLVAKGPPSEERRKEMAETIETLRQLQGDSNTGDREKAALKRDIATMETLPDVWGPPSQADWDLYKANEERIKSCGHGNRAVRALGDALSAYAGKSRTYIEFEPDEDTVPRPPKAPAPPSAPATR